MGDPRTWEHLSAVTSQGRPYAKFQRALKTGNADKAFGYAAPGIRAQFGDAATFLAMVRSAYSPLLLARSVRPRAGAA